MSQTLVLIGIAVVFIGIVLIIVGSMLGAKESRARFGFGGFIGPIPFGFASDKPMLYIVIALAIVLLVLYLFAGRVL